MAPEDLEAPGSTITAALGHGQRLDRLANVVNADRRSSVIGHHGREARDNGRSPFSGSPRIRPSERLREMPTTTRRRRDDLVEPPQELEIVLDGLAEPEAGVEADAILGDAGVDGELQPLLEKCHDLGHDVVIPQADHRPRLAEHVHQA